MNNLPIVATLSFSADEFLPHSRCLHLGASEGIVFVYIQAFSHQEYTRQCGEREGEGEMAKSGAIWGMEEKAKYYYANGASQQGQCVCVCVCQRAD